MPNSGQKLERLKYRTEQWDPRLEEFMRELELTGKPVIIGGDFNVAHKDIDVYNAGSSHLKRTAGTTDEVCNKRGVHTHDECMCSFIDVY